MPGNAGRCFDGEHIFCRHAPRLVHPVPNRWLRDADRAGERRLSASFRDRVCEGFVIHRLDYSTAYRRSNRQSLVCSDRQTYHDCDVTLSDRLAARMKELSISQAELGRRIGISQPSVSAILSGDTQRPKHLREIANALETTEGWLLGETADPTEGAMTALDREGMAERLGLHLVPEVDSTWAMGEGSFLDVVEQTGFRAFDREWLRSISSGNLSALVVARGDGDSMEPTLHDGDIVLIDQAQRSIERQDRIWAVTVGGLGVIKRVAKLPNGDYELASDNHRVRTRVVRADEFHVVGRVVWVGRKI